MTEHRHPPATTEPDFESAADRALITALNTTPLRERDLERIRAAVAQEWRAAAATPRNRLLPALLSRWIAFSAAAALAAAAVVLLVVRSSDQAMQIGLLSRTSGVGLEVSSGLFGHRTLTTGDALRVGDRFTARAAVLVALARGGTLRVAADSTLKVSAPAELSLDRGLIYLDISPRPSAANPLRVITRDGAVEHVGTEFEVKSDDQAVRIRVREGRIRYRRRSNVLVADAGTELLSTPGNEVSVRSIATYGGDWLWIAALAPDYEIEGRPLIGFLQWVSRELGRRVEFDDQRARDTADRTILHGSVRGQPPLKALSNVMATTSLAYELRDDKIWVRSGP